MSTRLPMGVSRWRLGPGLAIVALIVASVSLSVRVERAWAPEAALGQVNEMIVDARRSGTNPIAFYPLEGWLTDGTDVIGQRRFTADLVVVRDDLTARRWCDSREHAELIASRPSFYFLLTSPNETRDQATAALFRLLEGIDAAIQRHGC